VPFQPHKSNVIHLIDRFNAIPQSKHSDWSTSSTSLLLNCIRLMAHIKAKVKNDKFLHVIKTIAAFGAPSGNHSWPTFNNTACSIRNFCAIIVIVNLDRSRCVWPNKCMTSDRWYLKDNLCEVLTHLRPNKTTDPHFTLLNIDIYCLHPQLN
jgi:hypothetical protein